MAKIRKILVPIKELDNRRLPAVLKAAQVARAHGASLELFHALTSEQYPAPLVGSQAAFASLENEARQTALRRLEAVADRLRLHSIRVTVSAQWDYPEYEAIIRRAEASKADLIVISQHAGKHRMPWLMRLTDWELIRRSPVPLLLVKSPHLYRHPGVLAAIDPSRAHKKPLTLDRDILRTAAQWATQLRGSLHAVHGYVRFPLNVPPAVIEAGMIETLAEDAELAARKLLARAVLPQRISRKRQHLIPQAPVEAISAAVAQSRCTIVVMGAMSRSGFKRLLIGNTAEHVLDALPCDVLIVKPARFQSRVPKKLRGAMFGAADVYPYPLTPF